MIAEVIGLPQHRVADFSSRVSVRPFEQPLDALHPKLSRALPALRYSLGHQQQLVSGLERQDRRLIGHVREQSQRHTTTLQNMRALRIAKHGLHPARVAIRQNPKRQVETTEKGRGKRTPFAASISDRLTSCANAAIASDSFASDCAKQLPGSLPKGNLRLSRDRMSLRSRTRNVRQQEYQARSHRDSIEKVAPAAV